MNQILISDWEIFGIVALTSGLAITLGVFMTLFVILREKYRKASRNTNQTDNVNNISK
jgi:hypothetical protein